MPNEVKGHRKSTNTHETTEFRWLNFAAPADLFGITNTQQVISWSI